MAISDSTKDAERSKFERSPGRQNGHAVEVFTTSSQGTYSEVQMVQATPFISGNAVYNFLPSNFREYTAGAGTVTVEDGVFKVSSGTSLGDYGTITSFRSLNYKSGQGCIARFSARFPENEALTWSGCGLTSIGDEISFGYNGTDFGVWHRYGGKPEVQTLTITTGAGGSETATITVNDEVFSVPLTAGSVQHNAYEIEAYLNANATAFEAEQIDDTVIVFFLSDGDKTGAFTFSSSTAVASFTQTTQGVTKTSDHVAMSDWNSVNLFGFDPSKGNNYQIIYQNGFGNIRFQVQEPQSGIYATVHQIRWANTKTIPNFGNPSMRLAMYATSIGATTPVTVECAHIQGNIEGKVRKIRNPRAFSNTKNIDTTLTNIVTLRNSRVYNGETNQVELDPVYLVISNDGTRTARFEIRANPTVAGETNFQPAGNNIVGQYDISGGTVSSNGRLLSVFNVAKGSSVSINLSEFEIRVPPTLRIVVAGRMLAGSAADLTASFTWYEDI